VPIALKSGSLNLLETSGPFQACNGMALPLYKRKECGFNILKLVIGNKLHDVEYFPPNEIPQMKNH
jgi:hypothetical protein